VNTAIVVTRVVLAAVLAVAALGKALDVVGARKALMNFGVSKNLAVRAAPLLPTAELSIAVALLVAPSARWAGAAAVLLMLLFIVALVRALIADRRPECHCFGIFYSAPAGWDTVARNCVLAALAAFVVADGPGPSLTTWVSQRSAAELVAIALGLVGAALAVVAVAVYVRTVELRRDLDGAEGALAAVPPGLPVGAPAPEFQFQEARGGTLSLKALRGRGAPVLLIFAGRGCTFSWDLERDLARWQRVLADRLTIAVASHGTLDENVWQSQTLGISDVLLQPNYELLRIYRVRGTPSAVVISPDGRISSSLAQGQPAIEALVRVTLREAPAAAGEARSLLQV
jgi:hypothetical protein